MITIKDKKDCCGCTACYNACPKKAIEMQADQEGFLYPVIDQKKCVDCGICDATCPIINKVEKNPEQTEGYILRIKNNNVLFESTSGGGFTALAEYVLHNGGVVYGAGYDEMMNVICKRAATIDQLQEMRGSKFVQSTLGNTFEKIKKELQDAMLAVLTDKQRDLIHQQFVLGKTHQEIADDMGISRGSVTRAVNQALERIRRKFDFEAHYELAAGGLA